MKRKFFFLSISLFIAQLSFSQFPEDAYRFVMTNTTVGARASAMGGAYIGVADDYSATFWNPAGLAQLRRLEMTGGISNYSYSNSADFRGTSQTASSTSTALNDIGFVFPFPTVRGSLVFSFGYNRLANYASALSFNAFNDESSIIQTYLSRGKSAGNLPYRVFLTDVNGTYSSITKNVLQTGKTVETGDAGQWSFAGAIDIEENISAGISLNIISGKYGFTRNYSESDSKNLYANTSPTLSVDSAYLRFNKFYFDRYINSELSGSGITFGLMYRTDFFRAGITAKAPTTISIDENYRDEAQSVFDATGGWAGNQAPETYYQRKIDPYSYGVKSPWSFGFGVSYYFGNLLLLSGDLEYTDWTQMQWIENQGLEDDPDIGNAQMPAIFRSTTNFRLGAEVDIPQTDVKVRLGYEYKPSPFEGDPASNNQHTLSGGLGIILQRNVVIDAAMNRGTFQFSTDQYSGKTARTNQSITLTQFVMTVSYRF